MSHSGEVGRPSGADPDEAPVLGLNCPIEELEMREECGQGGVWGRCVGGNAPRPTLGGAPCSEEAHQAGIFEFRKDMCAKRKPLFVF